MAIDIAVDRCIESAVSGAIKAEAAAAIPLDIWVDPAVDPKRIQDNGNVQTLQKIEGTLADFTEADSGERPLYVSNGINGLGAIESQDADRRLGSNNVVSSSQISFVIQFGWMRTADNPGYIFSTGFSGGDAYVLAFDETIDKFLSRSFESGVGFIGSFNSANTFAVDAPVAVTLIYDAPNTSIVLRVNGIQEGSTSTVVTASTTAYNIILLNHWGTSSLGSIGQRIGAFMSNWGTLPSLDQIKARERYLMNRYAIS